MPKAGRWLCALSLLLVRALPAQAPALQSDVFKTFPSDRCKSSDAIASSFPFADLLSYMTGASWTHSKRTTACSALISSVPRAVTEYLDCDNWRCQMLGNLAAKGVIGAVERNMRAAQNKILGSSQFGLKTSMTYSRVDQARSRVEGGHRLSVLFLGLELRLPVQPFAFQRMCSATNFDASTTTFTAPAQLSNTPEAIARPGNPWGATIICNVAPHHTRLGMDWVDRYFRLNPFWIPFPTVGVGSATGMYLSMTHTNHAAAFAQTDSRATFADFVNRTIKPVEDDPDWSWLLPRPAESMSPLRMSSAWQIDLETPGAGVSAGVASAEIRGLISGSAASHFTHGQAQTNAFVGVAPNQRLQRTYSAGDSLEVDANLTAGLRVRIKAWRFVYTRDFTLPPLTSAASAGFARPVAQYSVVNPMADKTSPLPDHNLSACPAGVTPPPQPSFIPTDAPPPTNDGGQNIVQFASGIGPQIDMTYQFCSDSLGGRQPWDPTTDPGFLQLVDRYRRITDPRILATACAEIRRYLDGRAFLCTKAGRAPLIPWARLTAGVSRCQMLPA